MPEKTTNLNLPIPLGNENVNRQYFVDLIQAIDSGAVSEEQLADQVKKLTEGKQDVLRLADNYRTPTAAITEYPQGFSVFYVGGGTGGQGAAWATAAGATETFGWVETVRTGSAGYQTFTEMYSGTDTTATSGNRQFKRNKRDSNSFWQPFERILDQDDLVAHNADYVRQPGYGATAGTGAAYTVTLSPAPAALVDGLAITIVPHIANTVADPTLKIGVLGALPIRRQSGGQFAAGSIKAGLPLSLVKVGSYFLARSASPTGNATAAQVLAGYTFQSEAVPDGGTGALSALRSTQLTDNNVLGRGSLVWNQTSASVNYAQAICSTVDSDGNVYVGYSLINSSGTSKYVRKLDKNGVEIFSLSSAGNVSAIAVDLAKNIYIANNSTQGNVTLRKFNSNGVLQWTNSEVSNCADIAVDAAGNIYVAHGLSSGKSVRKLNSDGSEIWAKFDVGSAAGIDVDSIGNVYVAYSVGIGAKSIRKLNSIGAEIWANTQQSGGYTVAVDTDFSVYAGYFAGGADQKTARKLSSSGIEVWSKADNGIICWGVALSPSGVYFGRDDNTGQTRELRKLNKENGDVIWTIANTNGRGLSVSSDNYIYTTTNDGGFQKSDDGKYYNINI